MKKLFFCSLLLLTCGYSFGQTYGNLGGVNNGNPNWVNIGTLSLPQGGFDAFIRIIGGAGYNASTSQQGYIELHIRTSNGASVDANGFGFAATASLNGRGVFASQIHIVPNSSGVSATTYTLYAYCAPYLANTFYSVELSPGCSWTASNTIATGTPGGYNVALENVVNNDSFLIGHVGVNINSMPTGYQFAVNGNAIATSMTVKLYANWPDYVFKPDYELPALTDVKTYIDQNHHLPEIPSAAEIAKDGLNLGEMNKLLMKKVEELTLYLIEKDKEQKDLKEKVTILTERIQVLEKN
jgi:hypothetical protein